MLENFHKAKILVIGDVMLDEYLYGNVERISPEAPVPVVHVKNESFVPGGAANVANNISSLKARSFLIGVVGNDDKSKKLKEILDRQNVKFEFLISSRPTITKTRIVSASQQILRIDIEDTSLIENELEEKLKNLILRHIENVDAVIISDYGKGICKKSICQFVINEAVKYNKPVVVDPKKTDWERYENATVITPNLKELSEFIGKHVSNESENVEVALKEAYNKVKVKNLLVTRSEKGMSLFVSRRKSWISSLAFFSL